MGNEISKNEIIEKINYEVIPSVKCRRKCAAFKYCKFRKSYEYPCGLLMKFVENYVKTTFNLLRFKDDRQIQDYIQSIKFLVDFIFGYENWKGLILDRRMINYWAGFHVKSNEWYVKDFLKNLAQYLEIYENLHDIQKDYKYKIIVEGKSEIESLVEIGFNIEGCFIGSKDNYFNIEGGGNIQNLKFLITSFKENGIRIFFILDGGDKGNLRKIERLHEEKLIDKNTDNFSFKVCFENAFPPEVIYNSLREMIPEIDNFINLNFITRKLKQKKNIVKEIDKNLFRNNKSKLSEKKIEFAKILSRKLIDFQKSNPKKRIEILTILKRLNRQIQKERKLFFLS